MADSRYVQVEIADTVIAFKVGLRRPAATAAAILDQVKSKRKRLAGTTVCLKCGGQECRCALSGSRAKMEHDLLPHLQRLAA